MSLLEIVRFEGKISLHNIFIGKRFTCTLAKTFCADFFS